MANQTQEAQAKPSRRRRFLRQALVALVVAAVLGAAALGGMEYYTGRSEFCGTTCHIMAPYYESYLADVHSSSKVEAACIDCHYAPGERHTFEAKLRGLSQTVSYVSGRTGAARPRPHVRDESCLREGCHTITEITSEPYLVRDVKFNHATHLEPDPQVVVENLRLLQTDREQLEKALSPESLRRLDELAVGLDDPERLPPAVRQVLQPPPYVGIVTTAMDYIQRVRLDIRYRQVNDNLRCTTCHTYGGEKTHFSTRTEVCNTCHFINQPFNANTARCLNCHSPPQITVPVHAQTVSETMGAAVRAGTMDHSVIIENNVDCRSCHADLVRGTGQVTRERCAACHDLPRYLEEYENNLVPETVLMLHDKHVADLHAACTDCHARIEHRLRPKDALILAGGFLEPVRENCAHCHPNHHALQVEMIAGNAPDPIPDGGANAMFGSRVNCLGCHTSSTLDVAGTPVIEATKKACIACHSEDYEELFDQWVRRLEIRGQEVASLAQRVDAALGEQGGIEAVPPQTRQAIELARQTLAFVEAAKGIHNRNYALLLLDEAEAAFREALQGMGRAVPATAPATQPTASAFCPIGAACALERGPGGQTVQPHLPPVSPAAEREVYR